jgi:hypothetical protein
MNILNYHIGYNQSEKGQRLLEIAPVEHFFVMYILDIQDKHEHYLHSLSLSI